MPLLLVVAGCSSSAADTSNSGAPATEPTAPGEPSPEPCEDGTYRTADGACSPFPTLRVERSSVSLGPVRDHHTTMVVETPSGAWLYVVGGTDAWSTLHDDVQRARIGDDGKLGPFEAAGKLPDARAGHCMVKRGDRLYLFGGIVGTARMGPSRTSVVLTLDADGHVKSSAPGPELPLAVMHLSCELVGDWVYAIGGRGSNSRSTKLSARARIGADGGVSPFEAETPLSPDRSHHASFVHGKRLYVLGGITGDPVGASADNRKDVVAAEIGDDGSLGPWHAAGSLPQSISVSSAQLYKEAVYVVGGLEGDGFSAAIRRATFLEDGALSEFVTLSTKLPDARGHVHQTPMFRTFLFSVGGKNDDNESLGTVDVGRFD